MKKTEDLISVTIAAYNHEKYVQETLRSIIDQTYQNLELIIIDDGSSDNTFQKILEMKPMCEKRFARVIMKTQKNVGLLETSNRLRDLVKGKFGYAISSDDVIADKQAIEILHDYMVKHPNVSLCTGDEDYIDENSNRIYPTDDPTDGLLRDIQFTKKWLEENCGDAISGRSDISKIDMKYSDIWFKGSTPNGCLISYSASTKIIPFSVNCFEMEDRYRLFQLTKFSTIKVLEKVFIHYRIHKNNFVNQDRESLFIKYRGVMYYELYLLDTVYKDFYDPDCEKAPAYIFLKNEWELSKKSKLWDEEYYCSRYPDVKEKGYIPLVHYLSYGVYEKRLPSKFFEGKERFLFSTFNSLRWSRGKILKFRLHQYLRKKFLRYRKKQNFKSSGSFIKRIEFKIYKKLAKKLEYKLQLPRDLNEEMEFKWIAHGTYAFNKILKLLGGCK